MGVQFPIEVDRFWGRMSFALPWGLEVSRFWSFWGVREGSNWPFLRGFWEGNSPRILHRDLTHTRIVVLSRANCLWSTSNASNWGVKNRSKSIILRVPGGSWEGSGRVKIDGFEGPERVKLRGFERSVESWYRSSAFSCVCDIGHGIGHGMRDTDLDRKWPNLTCFWPVLGVNLRGFERYLRTITLTYGLFLYLDHGNGYGTWDQDTQMTQKHVKSITFWWFWEVLLRGFA